MTPSGVLSRAAVSAALVVFTALPGGAQVAVSTGTLPGGGTYTVLPDPAQPAAAVALWYRAPSSGFGDTPAPGLSRLAATTVAGSVPVTGTALGTLIARYGGRLSVSAFPDSVSITALVPPAHAADAVRAMTADYFAPVVTAAGLGVAQRDVVEEVLFRSYDPQEALEDALGAALFATGPLHDGTLGTPQGLREMTLDQVRSYAERAFRPANATLVLAGNVDARALAGVASRDGAPAGSEPPAPQTALPQPATLRRDANAAGVGLAWVGPPISDEAAATALDFVADAWFAPRRGLAIKAMGAGGPDVTGKFVTYHDPGVFLVTLSGDGVDEGRAKLARVLADAAKPLDVKTFESLRAQFIYDVLGAAVTPGDVTDSEGWYAVEGDPAYAPLALANRARYLQLARALTPDAVARVVARYLGSTPGVVTLGKSAPAPRSTT